MNTQNNNQNLTSIETYLQNNIKKENAAYEKEKNKKEFLLGTIIGYTVTGKIFDILKKL